MKRIAILLVLLLAASAPVRSDTPATERQAPVAAAAEKTQSSVAPNYNLNWYSINSGDSCEASAAHSFAAGRRAKAQHNGAFVWGDQTNADVASTVEDQFQVRAKGGANIFTDSALTAGVTLPAGSSAWAPLSDRAVKRNVRPVDGAEILARLADLPVSRWSYAAQDPSIEHVGPMAQDFYRLFGLGDDDRHISTLDPDGISLAAIKELHRRNQELSDRIFELESALAELRGE